MELFRTFRAMKKKLVVVLLIHEKCARSKFSSVCLSVCMLVCQCALLLCCQCMHDFAVSQFLLFFNTFLLTILTYLPQYLPFHHSQQQQQQQPHQQRPTIKHTQLRCHCRFIRSFLHKYRTFHANLFTFVITMIF